MSRIYVSSRIIEISMIRMSRVWVVYIYNINISRIGIGIEWEFVNKNKDNKKNNKKNKKIKILV